MKNLFTLFSLSLFFINLSAQNKSLALLQDQMHQRIEVSLSAGENTIQVCNLIPDMAYRIIISSNDPYDCNYKISKEYVNGKPSNLILFEAAAECEEIFISSDCNIKKHKQLNFSISKLVNNKINSNEKSLLAGITTDQNGDVASLIQDVFIGGDCFDVAGVTFSGAAPQLGSFANGGTSINIEDGVIISTGNIANSAGPNSAPNISTGFGNPGSDSDLDAISGGGSLFDIAKIEFDFTPTEDQITFEYAFASDEYCEYAGTTFNDVFGFFISGPGINGPYSNNSDNIAIVPATGDNVVINSVNHYTNVTYYLDNAITEGCAGGNPVAPNDIEFDGFTTVLTAIANVIPCETYHIKLVIADRGDAIFDSAVFLKANSFGGEAEATVSSEIGGNAASEIAGYEGCSNASVTFVRVGDDDSQDLVVNYFISGSSTATPGEDYEPFPTSVIIPAGQSSITITIEIYEDLITEGLESIFIELEQACSCTGSIVEIQILEPPPLEVILEDLEVCRDQLTTISPTVTGGVPPYSYLWSNGSTAESIDISVSDPLTLSVMVSDDCQLAESTIFTIYPTFPTAVISGQGSICAGNAVAYLSVELTGTGPWDITYSVNGLETTVTNILYSPFPIIEDEPGTYQLVSVVTADGCPGEVFGEAFIEEEIVNIAPTVNQISCFGIADGYVQLDVWGGTSPYTYNWDNNLSDQSVQDSLPAGIYFVTVTDDAGCEGIAVAFIDEPEELLAEVANLTNIDCINTTGSIMTTVVGGNGSYNFLWEDGSVTETLDSLAAGTYLLTVTDDSGCETNLEANIVDLIAYPDAVTEVAGELNCYSNTTSISAEGSSIDNVEYQWVAPGGTTLPENGLNISVSAEGFYTLIVTDTTNGCATEVIAEVIINNTLPLAQAGEDGVLNCNTVDLWLDASASEQNADISYQWDTPDGNITIGMDSIMAFVNAPGTYTLTVFNAENGCSSTDEVVVGQDVVFPNIDIQPPSTLTCDILDVTLTSAGSDTGAEFDYQWYTTDGTIISPSDSISILVAATGTYELEITNITNGCVSSLEVVVPIDTLFPVADAGSDIELDCAGTAVNIDGNASSAGANFVYEWTTTDGAFLSGEATLSPQTAVAGTYVLVVTNTENGCSSSDENIVINNTGSLPLTTDGSDILNCYNSSVQIGSEILDGSPDFVALWTSLEGNPISDPESLVIDVVAPGTYSIEVTNLENGCISIASIEVFQDTIIPIADAGEDQLINCFDPSTILDASGSDTGPNFSIQWSNPDGSSPAGVGDTLLETTLSGIFTLTIQNTVNGCINTDEVEIIGDFAAPVSQAGEDLVLNCVIDSVLLNGFANAGGDNFNFQWEDPQTNTILSTSALNNFVDEPGMYILSVFDLENGCITSDSVEVILDIESPLANAESEGVLNCDNATISLSSSNSSQGPDFVYQWTSLDQNIIISIAPEPVVGLPGNYQLIVTDTDNQCVDTAFVEVFQDVEMPIALVAAPDVITCADLSVNLEVTGSSAGAEFLYIWTLPDGSIVNQTTINSFEANEAGTYFFEVVNTNNGCESEASVVVESLAIIPTAEAGPAQLINCFEPQVTLNPSGSSTGTALLYQWLQDGVQMNQTSSPEPLLVSSPGMYELIVTDTSNDCVSIDTVIVDIDVEVPVAEAGTLLTLNCAVSSLNLDGSQSSTGNMSYLWSTVNGNIVSGGISQMPLVSAPGNYTLLVTNLENGCQSADEVEVGIDTIHPQLQLTPPEILTCSVTDILLQASSDGDYNYSWINPNNQIIGNSLSISTDIPGNYQFVATNTENECLSSTNIQVEQNITPPVAEAGTAAVLTCATTSLQLDGSQSSGNSTYLWTSIDGFILSGNTSLTPAINAPGTYTIQVTDNSNDCLAWDDVTIEQDIEVPVSIAATDGILTCTNTAVTLEGTSNSGLLLEYQWQTIAGQVLNTGNTDITVSVPGTYQFYVYNPVNGCGNTSTVDVEQDIEMPVADAGQAEDLTCIVTNLTLNGSVNAPGGTTYYYVWSGPEGGIIANGNTQNPIVQMAGTYTFEVTNTANGCTDTDEVYVDLITPTGIEVDIQQPLCHGDPAKLEIQTIEGGAGPFVYSINGGGSYVQNNSFTLLSPGWHLVVVQDANGCEYSEGVEMINIPEMEVSLAPLASIKLGESYQINANVNIAQDEIASITWTPADSLSCTDCLDPIATPYQTTDYLLQVVNQNGCWDEARLRLIVDERPAIYIPNVFSPNEDGNNDVFYIFAKENTVRSINSLQIFNRWGELVFEVYDFQPNDPQFGWNGFYRRQPMNSAVFVYWTEVELVNGETIILKGDVTIVR